MVQRVGGSFGLHWFRRDLRVRGNVGLNWSLKRHDGRVLGVFFFDPVFLARPDFSHNRFAFFLETLTVLRETLRERGGDLLILDRGPHNGFDHLLELLGAKKPASVSFNRDYEPFARARDEKIFKMLTSREIDVYSERDHLLFEPDDITRDGGGFYQIYSPFARRWFDRLHLASSKERLKISVELPDVQFKLNWKDVLSRYESLDCLKKFASENAKHVTVEIPGAGEATAMKEMKAFAKKISNYSSKRDFPTDQANSGLSIYLKNGSLTVPQIINELGLEQMRFIDKSGPSIFTRQLCWREFYYHILFHRPSVEKTAFLEKYKDIDWDNDKKKFKAWQEGMTGYPIVDAGMRELKQTGFMHNRVRMIVASFLTKHLLINWQWGEKHFMKELLDGDLAANNGGWQWAASTGCDPQPYFRVFNPVLQGKKFDPQGEYVREFVPELKDIPARIIHDMPDEKRPKYYPDLIVQHKSARLRALKTYKRLS